MDPWSRLAQGIGLSAAFLCLWTFALVPGSGFGAALVVAAALFVLGSLLAGRALASPVCFMAGGAASAIALVHLGLAALLAGVVLAGTALLVAWLGTRARVRVAGTW